MRYKVFLASVLMAAFLLAFLSPTHSRPSFKITTRPNFVDSLPGDTAVFEKVEVEASVDKDAWRGHLQNELQAVVEKAARKGMKPGEYTIMVRFLVQKDGSLIDVKALNDPGFGLAKGAEKVVRSGPKWQPGTVNGKPVRSYHSQPISFVISP